MYIFFKLIESVYNRFRKRVIYIKKDYIRFPRVPDFYKEILEGRLSGFSR